MVTPGGAPRGATGIHKMDFRSLEMVSVPSFFLYAAEPLTVAMFQTYSNCVFTSFGNDGPAVIE